MFKKLSGENTANIIGVAVLATIVIGFTLAMHSQKPACPQEKPYCNVVINGLEIAIEDEAGPAGPRFILETTKAVGKKLLAKGLIETPGTKSKIFISVSKASFPPNGEMGLVVIWDYVNNQEKKMSRLPAVCFFHPKGDGDQGPSVVSFIADIIDKDLLRRVREAPPGQFESRIQ